MPEQGIKRSDVLLMFERPDKYNMLSKKDRQRFERMTLRHLPEAYNLALWLVRNPAEADDIVQTAYMRAFEAFGNFTGNNTAAWIMTIVRNTAFNLLNKQKRNSNLLSFDEAIHINEQAYKNVYNLTPEEMSHLASSNMQVADLIDRLPVEFREVLFLRDIEGYSYKEIAEITQSPKGTVMSRLSRARKHLQKQMLEQQRKEQSRGV